MELSTSEKPVGSIPRSAWAIIIAFFALSVVLGVLSEGCYHDDDLTHYMMARWVWWYPSYLLHIWGRPGFTAPMSLVCGIGDRFFAWHLARVLSAVVTACGAILAVRLGRRLGVGPPWLIALLCYVQPLAMVLSYTTLTENWTAFYLIGAASLLLAGRARMASLVFSLALVSRHEAVIFIPIWWLAILTQGSSTRTKITAALLSLWAPLAHNLLFFGVFQEWPARIYFQPHGSTEYLPSGPLSYMPAALYAMTPLILGSALAGAFAIFRRDRWIVAAIPFLFLLVHLWIKWQGIFASGGYGRFMVAVAPFIAILATRGLSEIIQSPRGARPWICLLVVIVATWYALEHDGFKGPIDVSSVVSLKTARAGIGLLTLISLLAVLGAKISRLRPATKLATGIFSLVTLAQWGLTVHPLRLQPEHEQAVVVADWLRNVAGESPVFTTNAWLVFELGLVENPRAHKDAGLLASMPAGTYVVWDSRYSPSDFHQVTQQALYGPLGCVPLHSFFDKAHPYAIRFEAFRKLSPPMDWKTETGTYPRDLAAERKAIRGVFYAREQ